jgi:hypothetical protein
MYTHAYTQSLVGSDLKNVADRFGPSSVRLYGARSESSQGICGAQEYLSGACKEMLVAWKGMLIA